jgi:hypothetical protein
MFFVQLAPVRNNFNLMSNVKNYLNSSNRHAARVLIGLTGLLLEICHLFELLLRLKNVSSKFLAACQLVKLKLLAAC